jgi:plastocyanin
MHIRYPGKFKLYRSSIAALHLLPHHTVTPAHQLKSSMFPSDARGKKVMRQNYDKRISTLLVFALVSSCSLPTFAKDWTASSNVTIESMKFKPSNARVKEGGTVTWTNKDSAPHTIAPDKAGQFTETAKMNQGESATITFDKAGLYKYHCGIHPKMKAVVNVQKPAKAKKSG